jgi:hypothetical protein
LSYETRKAIARLLYLVAEKDLRQGYCPCRRPLERFIDERIQTAMDDVERLLASDGAYGPCDPTSCLLLLTIGPEDKRAIGGECDCEGPASHERSRWPCMPACI